MMEGRPGADSEEKREPVSDIDTAVADSLKVLDLKRPIREADMCAGNWCPHPSFAGDGEFNPDPSRCGAIIGTTALAEINDAYEAKWTQHCVIEAATTINVGDT